MPDCTAQAQALEDAKNQEAAAWGIFVVKWNAMEAAYTDYDNAVIDREAAQNAYDTCMYEPPE